MSNISNTNDSSSSNSSTTGGVFFRFSIGSPGQLANEFSHITRLEVLDPNTHPFSSLLFHNFPYYLFTNDTAFSLHRALFFLQSFEKDFLLDSFFKQFSLKTTTLISLFNSYYSSFISSYKSNKFDKNQSLNLDSNDVKNINSSTSLIDKIPNSNLKNLDFDLANSPFFTVAAEDFFHHLSTFSSSSPIEDLSLLPNLLANFSYPSDSNSKGLLANLFFTLSSLSPDELNFFLLSNIKKAASLRSHYHILLSFEGKFDTSLARNLAKEYLLAQFPDAPFVASVHQHTSHTHVQVLLLAVNIHDKKLYFPYKTFRNLDLPWAKIYAREFGVDKLYLHLNKKSQTQQWKIDRFQGIHSDKPQRVKVPSIPHKS